MIIPVKCFTCGMVLADRYRAYLLLVNQKKLNNGSKDGEIDKVLYLTSQNQEKTAEGEALDELKIEKICCRRHFLTHVDID